MKKVLVIGDVIIDEYVYGKKLGVSAETPTVVAEYQKRETFLGGAGLVSRHLAELGCETRLFTVEGDDFDIDLLNDGVRIMPFYVSGWAMTRKTRYFVDDYKMVQYDVLNRRQWDDRNRCDLYESLCECIGWADEVIVSDNRHGFFDRDVAEHVVSLCKKTKKKLYVDSQLSQKTDSNLHWYKGADCFFVNERELRSCVDRLGLTLTYEIIGDASQIFNEAALKAVSGTLQGKFVLKLGDKGSVSFPVGRVRDGFNYVPAKMVPVVDTCGAGDAYLAAYVSSGGDEVFANWWAGRSTLYRGTVVPPLGD